MRRSGVDFLQSSLVPLVGFTIYSFVQRQHMKLLINSFVLYHMIQYVVSRDIINETSMYLSLGGDGTAVSLNYCMYVREWKKINHKYG